MLPRRELFAVALGGALGTLLRTALSALFPVQPGSWPWVTFAVNLAAATLLGYVASGDPHRLRRPLLGTGFCGALSTFSALQLELLWMLDVQRFGLAALYVALSLGAGLLGVRAAARLAT